MHRFYVPGEQISGKAVRITGSDMNHIKNVLRLKSGDRIEVFDSAQNVFVCEIKEFNREFIRGTTLSQRKNDIESSINVTFAQCLAKGKKMDLIIKMAVELGVNTIIPVRSERSVPRIEGKEEKKIAHWQTIAKEAAEQSGRTVVPRVLPLSPLVGLKPKDYDLALMPWEAETNSSLRKILSTYRPNHLLVVIGPEGGFSQAEAARARTVGFKLASLGKRILRCETAALCALSQVYYELET